MAYVFDDLWRPPPERLSFVRPDHIRTHRALLSLVRNAFSP